MILWNTLSCVDVTFTLITYTVCEKYSAATWLFVICYIVKRVIDAFSERNEIRLNKYCIAVVF